MSGANSHGHSIQVLEKAALLLDVLAERQEASAADLAAAIAEPRSSVYRLLGALQHSGFVEPTLERGMYRLGLKLYSLGVAVSARFGDASAAALPHMQGLHDATGDTVFLIVRRGYEAFCFERIDGRVVQLMILRRGSTLPLHAASGGRVLLAHEPPEFREEYFRHWAQNGSADLPLREDQLRPQLDEIERDGIAVSDQDVLEGIASIGAPIFDHQNAVVAALSMSGLRDSVLGARADRNIAAVRQAAEDISQVLGHGALDGGRLRGARATG